MHSFYFDCMKNIEICFSPDLMDRFDVKGKDVVVVDILRATSCITAGIASGVKSIRPVLDLEEAREFMKQGYLGAAERNGAKVDDFDIGNSPFSYMEKSCLGKKVVISTTNGTVAIHKSKEANRVLIASFLNLSAVANFFLNSSNDLIIVCSGWKGRVNFEDSIFAGALYSMLKTNYETNCDSVLISELLWENAKSDLFAIVKKSAHVQRLKKIGIEKDIKLCCEIDKYSIIPVLEGEEIIKG